jgi:hypothetical protein
LPVQPSDTPIVSFRGDSANVPGSRENSIDSPETVSSFFSVDGVQHAGAERLETHFDLIRGSGQPVSTRLEVGLLPGPAGEKSEKALVIGEPVQPI